MRKTHAALLLAASLLLTLPAQARDIEMLVSPPQPFIQAGEAALAQNRQRIIAAAQSLGWQVTAQADDHLQLSYDKQGKHQVRLKVELNAQTYQIHYVDSHNMNYSSTEDGARIHPNYNRWIRNLQKRISDFAVL